MIPSHMSRCAIHGGLPVPKIVVDNRLGHVELAKSTWPGADLMTVWVGESGGPDFGKYDEEKHRQCMATRWCHVCGWQAPDLLVCVPDTPQLREVNGSFEMLVSQPWVCAPCLAYAGEYCPPLRSRIVAGQGHVLSISVCELVSTYWRPVNPEDPVPPEGQTVLSAIKLLPRRFASQPLPSWDNTVGRRLRRKMHRDASRRTVVGSVR